MRCRLPRSRATPTPPRDSHPGTAAGAIAYALDSSCTWPRPACGRRQQLSRRLRQQGRHRLPGVDHSTFDREPAQQPPENLTSANGYGGALCCCGTTARLSALSWLASNSFTGSRAGTAANHGFGGALAVVYSSPDGPRLYVLSNSRAVGRAEGEIAVLTPAMIPALHRLPCSATAPAGAGTAADRLAACVSATRR